MQNNFFLKQNQDLISNQNLSEKSLRRLSLSKAASTIKAYESDWMDFSDWCMHHQVQSLPASPETIVNYINDLADNAATGTIARRITAISENHIAAGFDAEHNPAHENLVRAAIAAIKREKGTFQKGKAPILFETLSLLANVLQGNAIVTLRDKALIYLGFAGAFRRSELVNIDIEHLTFTPKGLIIFIPKSKGDQLGQGNSIAIPYAPNPELCAVTAVKKWIAAAEIKNGPLFRPFKKNGKTRTMHLSGNAVAVIIKKYAALAGLDETQFAGHSLRRGFATSAAQHNVDVLGIMKQTRHKSEKMVHRYIEQGTLFQDNPLDKIYKDS